MSQCPRCAVNRSAHSMFELGQIGYIPVIYNAPVKATEIKECPESYSYFVSHIDYLRGKPWILLVDCKGMKLRNSCSIGLLKQIIHYLNETHESNLQEILLLNPNAWMRACLAIVRPFLKKTLSKKLKLLKTELEVYVELSGYGSVTGVIGALRKESGLILGEEEEE